MALDIEDPSSYEPNLVATLAAFEEVAWPVFERRGFSRGEAVIVFYLSALTGAALELADAIRGIDDDGDGEPWRG